MTTRYLNCRIWLFAVAVLAGLLCPAKTVYRLQEGGKAQYAIVIPDSAHATEKRAASELSAYLQRIVGTPFTIVPERDFSGTHGIYIGQTRRAASQVDLASFHPEEWLIRSLGDGALILTGGKYAGIYYSVVDYLERQCNVRWLDEECEVVPEDESLEVGQWNLRRKPSFAIRQVFDMLDWCPTAGRFKERNKGFSYTQEETGVSRYFGGERPYHSAGDYAKDWPKDKAELFSRDAQGRPMIPVPGGDAGGQICMTSPEARQRVLDTMRGYIMRDRRIAAEKKCAPPRIYDFSGNDNPNKCTCPGCMRLAEQEESYAGATLDFINWVAREIGREYPDIIVKTFAYMYCEKPPKRMKAEPNVMIHVALGGMEFGGAYSIYDTMRPLDHKVNQKALERFRAWGECARHLLHWEYWTLYPIIPEPVVHVNALCRDIEIDKQCHIEAFFAEYENPAFNSFSTLARWLAFKLTDDAAADKQALIRQFMEGYYGPAAPAMTALLNYMEERQEAFDGAIGNVNVAWRPYLDDDYFRHAMALIRQAEKDAAGHPEVIARVRRELPCLLSGLLSRWQYLKDTSRYDAPALIEEFRTESYKAMDFFFREDKQDFRKSQGFDQTVENFCISFRAETGVDKGALPPGVALGADTEYVSLNASCFIHEAKAKLVDDPMAFGGKASRYEYGNDNLNLLFANWMEGIIMAKFNLTEALLPRDGKYHWLDVGRVRFINNGRAHILVPENMQGVRIDLFRKVLPGNCYQVFVSLKCDDKAISCDRMLMLRENPPAEKNSTAFVIPQEVKTGRCVIIPAGRLNSPASAALREDSAAFGGSAWCNSTAPCSSAVCTDFGIYDPENSRGCALAYSHKDIADEEYHLIKITAGQMPGKDGAYLYCGSDWQIQGHLPGEIRGKKGTLYALAKFTGPRYVPGSSQPDGFHIGGMVFVEE